MDSTMSMSRATHGNLQKHQNPNPLQRKLIDRFHTRIGELIRRTGATRMLDAGCGEGFLLQHLLQESRTPDYIGSDLRLEAIQWARREVDPDFTANVANVLHLPYPDNAFPLVVCLEVLEHLPDSAEGLRELARVSSQDIIISVPHEPFFRTANFLRGKHLGSWGNDPEHLHNYSGRAFRALAQRVVDVVWHGYVFPWQIIHARKR